MEKLIIKGGNKLHGTVNISGFKNSAVAIIPATVLAGDTCVIDNLPQISDVKILADLLSSLGADVKNSEPNMLKINTSKMRECYADYEMAKELRASYYLLGAALGRFKKAKVAYPGGCSIGNRPIDQHIKGFEALGADVNIEHGIISVEAEKLTGAEIYLDVVSVGATINIMLAAVMAEGTTIIENAAKEPHIVDIANYLNCMGADVRGAGTDVINLNSVPILTSKLSITILSDVISPIPSTNTLASYNIGFVAITISPSFVSTNSLPCSTSIPTILTSAFLPVFCNFAEPSRSTLT
jgi:UDP-N-acetylglucosamine 1-carboxyvinyltransferase